MKPAPVNPDATICQCWGGSTHGTDDPNVRRCDLCGGIVPDHQVPMDGVPRVTSPAQSSTTIVKCEVRAETMALIEEFAKTDPFKRGVIQLCEQAIEHTAREAMARLKAKCETNDR